MNDQDYPELTQDQIDLANSFNEVANEFVSILSNKSPIYDEEYASYTARLGPDQSNSLIATQAIKKIANYRESKIEHPLLNALKAAAQITTKDVVDRNVDINTLEEQLDLKRKILEGLFADTNNSGLPTRAWKNPQVKISVPVFKNF